MGANSIPRLSVVSMAEAHLSLLVGEYWTLSLESIALSCMVILRSCVCRLYHKQDRLFTMIRRVIGGFMKWLDCGVPLLIQYYWHPPRKGRQVAWLVVVQRRAVTRSEPGRTGRSGWY